MKQYQKCYELKNAAKDRLDGKYLPSIIICLTSIVIEDAVVRLTGRFMPNPVSDAGPSIPAYIFIGIFSLALNLVLGVMNLGLAFFFLKAACGQPYRLSDLFYGYKSDSSRALVISGVYTLLTAVCQLPCEYLWTAYLFTHSKDLLIATLIAAAIGICIYLPVSAGISLCFFLLLDFPQKSAREVLSLSFRIMNGSKRRWVYMILSFLPLAFLCICTFYIGFLWLIPYMNMTYACFFLDVMNPKETA